MKARKAINRVLAARSEPKIPWDSLVATITVERGDYGRPTHLNVTGFDSVEEATDCMADCVVSGCYARGEMYLVYLDDPVRTAVRSIDVVTHVKPLSYNLLDVLQLEDG